MSVDFIYEIILRPVTDDWGPYQIDLTGGLPLEETIQTATIRAYEGRIYPGIDRTTLTDIADEIIEPGSQEVVENTVTWAMQLDAASQYRNTFITLVFEILTSGDRQFPFYFHGVCTF